MVDDKKSDEIVEETNVTEESEQPEPEKDTEDESPETEVTKDASDETDEEPKGPNIFQRLWAKYKAKKKLTIPATIAAVLILLFVVPATRYGILGVVIKKDVQVTIIDSQTNVPVSGVDVSLRGKAAKTDGEGKATIRGVKVGKGDLKASKKYYKDTVINFLTGLKPKPVEVKLEATGRQVPVHIVNKISGENVAGASIRVADTEAQTDQNGETTLVLPASKTKMEAKITKDGYNEQTVQVTVNNPAIKDNTFGMTPFGKIYFLSKKTGKIDVVKTDLDGANRQTVLAGTGNEEEGNTVLLASQDWKYLALQSRREDSKARLYLIDTSNDKLTEIDSGEASFTPIGWSGHSFVYTVLRFNVQAWQPKAAALKTYNAEALQLLTIDETNAEGNGLNDYANEVLSNVYILKDSLIYTKHWNASYYSVYRLAGKRMGIYSVKASGGGKQTVKDFDAGNSGYFDAKLASPNEIYFGVYNGTDVFYEYAKGALTETKSFNRDSFNKFYPTYLVSPGGNATFWYEPRDGKNTLFTGNVEGENAKELASLSEYVPYGWYSDKYLLVSKNGSELYIQPAGGLGAKGQLLKISDYHKPNYSFYGYGYGYGGL